MVGVEEGEAMVLVDDVAMGKEEKWDTTVSCPIWWKRWGGGCLYVMGMLIECKFAIRWIPAVRGYFNCV
jgi:hypothetical protein